MHRYRTTWLLAALLTAGIGIGLPARGESQQALTAAQTGIIAFKDGCTGRLYAMRADGSGRVVLPLPPLAQPSDEYLGHALLDVSTSGPLTVFYYMRIGSFEILGGQKTLTEVDYNLLAVQVNDVGGTLTLEPLVHLTLPVVAGVDPNQASWGSFSSAESRNRLALVTRTETGGVLMTAQIERDAASKIVGLSDLVAVGDLSSIGVPDTAFPNSPGFTGFVDYSPDGNSVVASIFHDLWRIHLDADESFLSAERLTEGTDGFSEWNPAVSPDGSRVAYTGVRIGGTIKDQEIYALAPASGAVTRVTHKKNRGQASMARDNAMWSSDSAWIGFSAVTSKSPRNSTCSFVLNSEIFRLRADGSTTATKVTDTVGTSVESFGEWGW